MADPIYSTAPSLERQVIEMVYGLRNAEVAYNLDHPNAPVNNVSIVIDSSARAMLLSVRVDADFQFEDGQIVMRASEYIPAVGS
jgi:hypothetical protein